MSLLSLGELCSDHIHLLMIYMLSTWYAVSHLPSDKRHESRESHSYAWIQRLDNVHTRSDRLDTFNHHRRTQREFQPPKQPHRLGVLRIMSQGRRCTDIAHDALQSYASVLDYLKSESPPSKTTGFDSTAPRFCLRTVSFPGSNLILPRWKHQSAPVHSPRDRKICAVFDVFFKKPLLHHPLLQNQSSIRSSHDTCRVFVHQLRTALAKALKALHC